MTNVFLFQASDTSISSNKLIWCSGRQRIQIFCVQAFITLVKICNISGTDEVRVALNEK